MKIYDSRKLFTSHYLNLDVPWIEIISLKLNEVTAQFIHLSRNVSLIKVIDRNLICSDILREIITELD